MNKKTNRSNMHAPTVKPVASIAPSATLALDGEFPLSASNGMSATEPSAAHDVLQAAMAPREGDAVDGADGADAAAAPTGQDVQEQAAPPAVKDKAAGKKPARAEKPVKEKFVKYAFTLPESEMLVLDAMKKSQQDAGSAVKKSQLLRAGLLALADLDADRLAQLLAQVPNAPRAGKKKK